MEMSGEITNIGNAGKKQGEKTVKRKNNTNRGELLVCKGRKKGF